MALTATKVKNLQANDKKQKLSDGNGLYLEVSAKGKKSWTVRYSIHGERKWFKLGGYPEYSLADARAKCVEINRLAQDGIDPKENKEQAKREHEFGKNCEFGVLAQKWFEVWRVGKAANTTNNKRRWLGYIKELDKRDIRKIKRTELHELALKIQAENGVVSAQRVLSLIKQIFDHALLIGLIEYNPALDLRKALQQHIEKHHDAITTPKEFGQLLADIHKPSKADFNTSQALKLLPLIFCRPGELVSLQWDKVDFAAKQLEIHSTKTDTHLIVPLSDQAIEILKFQHQYTGDKPYVFASYSKTGYMSISTLGQRLGAMGYNGKQRTHGFRASARTMLDEVLNMPVDWIEAQLGHMVRDTNGRAYNRTTHLEQRRDMLQQWADYLDELREQAMAE